MADPISIEDSACRLKSTEKRLANTRKRKQLYGGVWGGVVCLFACLLCICFYRHYYSHFLIFVSGIIIIIFIMIIIKQCFNLTL